MHFAAFLDVGESVRSPAIYYRNNVVGALSVLEAMVAERVGIFVFSSTCATYGEPIETPIAETHPQQPINSYGETKLVVERALVHFERAYGLRSIALRYFNAAGADPDGEIGEDHAPEIHLIPRAIQAAVGGPGLQVFGDDYPTPDGTCLRDYIHVSDLADAHVKALEALVATGRSGAYNLGTGQPHSVREVIAAVERVTGRTVPWTLGPRRPGDPAVLYAAPDKAQVGVALEPAVSRISMRLSGPRGSGTAPIRTATAPQAFVTPPDPLNRLFRYAKPYRVRLVWAVAGMIVYAVGSAGLAWLVRPIFDNVLSYQQRLSFTMWAIVVVYLLKGIGSYVSSYLMADVGQRVVMDVRNALYRHILGQSAGFFAHRTTGELMSRINNDVGQVQQAVSETVGDLARESLSLVGFLALMIHYDLWLSDRLPHRRTADRLSPHLAGPARPPHDTAQPGSALAPVASQRRGVHRPPDREGVRHRGIRGREVQQGRRANCSART